MKNVSLRQLSWMTVAMLCCVGCVSKNKTRIREQQAFIAGQQQAMSQLRATQTTQIHVLGEVQTPMLPWQEGMTLAEAIVAANYRGFRDPKEIVIERQNGQVIMVNPKALLRGEDEPLQPGDRIILR